MSSPACFVTTIDLKHADRLQRDLENQGFTLGKGPYMVFQAKKKGVSCTLYQSGKLTVQGKDKGDFITYYLEPEILKTFTYSHPAAQIDKRPRIGIDEAGKGDLFGPLTICALHAGEKEIEFLLELGVKDSKKLSDRTILKQAAAIKKRCAHQILELKPKTYNALYARFRNLNHLLAWGHVTALADVLEKKPCRTVIIDQFAAEHVIERALERKKLAIEVTQRHRGEEDLVVAAASIIARASFVTAIDNLSAAYGQRLPKGASKEVRTALKLFCSRHGKEALADVAKLHFKTIQEVS